MGSSMNFNLVYQNIRSIRKNLDKLLVYIGSGNLQPQIIGLSEIWIYDNEVANYGVKGYDLFTSCLHDKRSGGVAVYAHSSLNCKQFNLLFQTFNAVGLTFFINSKLVCIICIYRLGYTDISSFIDEFSGLLEGLSHSNLIIMGDFNIDFLKQNAMLDRLLILLSEHGLDNILEPTRITNTTATCIDNVLHRFDQRYFPVVSYSVLDLKISDHCLIEIKITGTFNIKSNSRRTFEVLQIDFNKLKELLLYEVWTDVYSCLDASKAYDNFIKIFKGHIKKSTSIKLCANRSTKLKPWMSDDLLRLIRKRNNICRLAKKHNSNRRLKQYSLTLCDSVNLQIDIAKKSFYSQKFSNNGSDARKNWKTVNEIINGQPDSVEIKEIVNQRGCKISGPVQIANEFNEFFTSVGDANAASLLLNDDKNRIICQYYQSIDSCVFSEISSGEVYFTILSLKNNSTPGLDGISNNVVKKMSWFLVDVLSFIFNLSLVTGTFPTSLKRALVVPIFKNNDKTSMNNYRPISLLSVFSKIFEKAIKSRIVFFLEKRDFFSPDQYGFRKNKNTEQAIVSFLEQVTEHIDKGSKVSTLFIDLTKAFDRVQHSTLLKKLYCCGFRGITRDWLSSYLHGRTQLVRVNGQLSKELPINVGVPQGSVLGPLLFLVYVNGIFRQQFRGSPTAFADDFSFTYASPSYQENIMLIDHDLKSLSIWLEAHNFVLSHKTKLLHFRDTSSLYLETTYHTFKCSRNNNTQCPPNDCFLVNTVDEFRYLGIIIDRDLNWKAHTQGLKTRLSLVSRKMYVLRLFCPQYLLRTIYFALADSILQYGLSCWGSACNATLRPIYVRQKQLIRIMCFKPSFSPSWPLFENLSILPLRHIFVFKVLRIFYVKSGNNFVTHAGYNLRSNHTFLKHIPKFRLDLRRNFINIVAPIIFNNLPLDIRKCGNFSSFSIYLKEWLHQTKNIDHLFQLLV